MKPLFIPLKTKFFEMFERGDKTVEYRPYGPRWNERVCVIGREVILSKGYGDAHRLKGVVVDFEVSHTPTTSEPWITCYGANKGPAACIHMAQLQPIQKSNQ